MSRIDDKIKEVELYLCQLNEVIPVSLEKYAGHFKIKLMCERLFEKIVETLVDLAYLIINENKFKSPENDEQAFYIMGDNKIISNELAEKLRGAKGMRNIIAHEYGKVDDELVYEAVSNELINDTQEFIKSILKFNRQK